MFEKIPARAMSDHVAQQLLKQIEVGSFSATGKLPTEAVLAQEFGVSRTVIREAISRLKNEGVVEPRQGSGVYVNQHGAIRPLRIDYAEAVEATSLPHLLAVRRAIEAEVAAEAALNHTDEDMADIDDALRRIDDAVAEGRDGVAEDVAFHRTIAAVTGNPYFLKTLQFLNQYLEAGVKVTRRNEATREDFSRQVREEHAAIADAIRARDPMAARNAARTDKPHSTRDTTTPPQAPTQAEAAVPQSWTLEAIQSLEWKRFELLCVQYYELMGFTVKTVPHGPDGGIDATLYKAGLDAPVAVVQCKAWSKPVKVEQVRALGGSMLAHKVKRGVFWSLSGYIGNPVQEFSELAGIQLLDGPAVLERIRALDADKQAALLAKVFEGDYRTPSCPACGVKLVARNGRNGVFWGCSNYWKRCRYKSRIGGVA